MEVGETHDVSTMVYKTIILPLKLPDQCAGLPAPLGDFLYERIGIIGGDRGLCSPVCAVTEHCPTIERYHHNGAEGKDSNLRQTASK